jgi:hypothetical protein
VTDLATFIRLGFGHITDLEAMDHILFLLALAAIYRPGDWRKALWVVSAFTVGHSITLALAVTGAVRMPTSLIEFLIPLTILVTCIENILVRDWQRARLGLRYRPVLAGVFGLVHGAGFANYLRDVFAGPIAVPLSGFNVGIELGQIVVLTISACLLVAGDQLIALGGRIHVVSTLRVRTMAVSTVILIVAARWAVERNPW